MYGLECRDLDWPDAIGKLIHIQAMRAHEFKFLCNTIGDVQAAAQANQFNNENVTAFITRFLSGPGGTTNHIVYFDSFSVEIERDRP